uniref:Ig-like domain-containing protein n=1 Tax=Fundulus heteroclitus TaxID=8078 RepID=A0A3Q2QEC0_FUNHE
FMLLCLFLFLLFYTGEVISVNNTPAIIQQTGIKTAKVGETVTLSCSCKHDSVTHMFWYQQSLGGKPHMISKRMKQSTEAEISSAYEKRFQVLARSGGSVNDLIITDLLALDSGTYYCVVLRNAVIEFGQGVFLHVKTSPSDTQSSIQQPKLQLLRPGESVNLSCSVYAERCAEEPNLYWLRHEELQPAVMYPSDRHCTSALNGTFNGTYCTSNLELHLVRSSDAGIYHCALASCGVVVFGEGTKVEIVVSLLLVYCLSVALMVFILGLLVLSSLVYKLKLTPLSSCTGEVRHYCLLPEKQAESLHYAALNLKRRDNRQRQEDIENVCVYSGVRSRK